MSPAWIGIGIVLGLLVGLMTLLRWYSRSYAPHPELVRKLLHIAMALVAATFPWLFPSLWPVLLLFVVTLPAMLALRRSALLQRYFGDVIHGIERSSWGEIVFPAGLALTFTLAAGNALLYCLPVVVLALADPAAALVGLQIGRRRYRTADGWKSLEGSAAFFIVALLAGQLILLLLSRLDHASLLLTAALLAGSLTIVEGCSWAGLDNLFIPVLGLGLLQVYLSLSLAALLVCCALVAALSSILVRRALSARPGNDAQQPSLLER